MSDPRPDYAPSVSSVFSSGEVSDLNFALMVWKNRLGEIHSDLDLDDEGACHVTAILAQQLARINALLTKLED